MNAKDPREIIDKSAMTTAQFVVVVITVLLNAMDGFDILSIAFASPGIAKEWGIQQLALGIVLSMELIGMAIGSAFLGGVADKIGRRPTLLGCLVVMASGMLLATTATSPVQLSIWRILTGLGIGGMLSCTNAVVAEFSNNKWRSLCISFMVIGYPLGGGFGGLYASNLIARYDWRAVFYFGAAATAVLLPLAYLFVPESVHWLARRQPANALARINASLKKLGQMTVSALPEMHVDERKKTVADIFSPSLIGITLIVTAAYFTHIVSFYFLLKWAPTIVTGMGFAASQGGRILTMGNFGGAAGGAAFGLLTARIGLKPLTIAILALNSIAIVIFGRTPADIGSLTLWGVIVGFFGNAAVSGLYSIVAYAFPTHVRATGTGFVIGVGRGGAIVSPWIAGYLFQSKMALPDVAMIMCIGSLVAAGLLIFLKLNVAGPEKLLAKKETRVAGLEPSTT
jgi:benzoate transport